MDCNIRLGVLEFITVNPLLTPPPGGACLFQTHLRWGGGLNRDGWHFFFWGGGCLFHKELKYNLEKLKYKKLEVMQPRIKNKSEPPVAE